MAAANGRTLVVRGGRLIDGSGRPPIEPCLIVIESGRVKAVEAGAGQGPEGPHVETIEATGKSVLPGLWDAHVHYQDWMAELYLAHGVTSILDAGNHFDWVLAQRDGIAKGHIRGPRMFACGSPLGGHPHFGASSTVLVLETAEEAGSRAREQIERGIDAVKVWAFLDREQTRAAARAAHEAGLAVVAHLTTSAADAAQDGVDCLAHATGLPMACVKDAALAQSLVERERERMLAIVDHRPTSTAWSLFARMEEDTFDGLAELLLEKGVFIEPDFVFRWAPVAADRAEQEYQDYRLLNEPGLSYVPEAARLRITQAWRNYDALKPSDREDLQRGYDKFCSFVRLFVGRGGRVVTGSDTSSSPMPGMNVQRELEFLVKAGLSPMQAICAATRHPAEMLRRSTELGTVEPGKAADLIMVDGDPLEDIRATRRITAVLKEGVLLDTAYHAAFTNPIPRPNFGFGHGNPVPRIAEIAPALATQGDGPLALRIVGGGFMRQSVVSFDGARIPTAVKSATELEATIPARLLSRAGLFTIWVTNPKPVHMTDFLHMDERSNPAQMIVRFR